MSNTGRVLWFDDRKGYGFIEDTGPSKTNYFAHWSQVLGDGSGGRRYLITGEFVRFDVQMGTRVQAMAIRGILPGYDALLCDLGRVTFRKSKKSSKNSGDNFKPLRPPAIVIPGVEEVHSPVYG